MTQPNSQLYYRSVYHFCIIRVSLFVGVRFPLMCSVFDSRIWHHTFLVLASFRVFRFFLSPKKYHFRKAWFETRTAHCRLGSVSSRECLDAPAILATFTAGRTGLVAYPWRHYNFNNHADNPHVICLNFICFFFHRLEKKRNAKSMPETSS